MAWHLAAFTWFLHAALGGSLFLLAGALAVRRCRQPVRRVRLIELTLLGALFLPWVSYLPGWPCWSMGWLTFEPTLSEPAFPAAPREPPATTAGPQRSAVSHAPDEIVAAEAEAGVAVPTPALPGEALLGPVAALSAVPPGPTPPLMLSFPLLFVIAYGCIAAVLVLRALGGLAYLVWLCCKAYPAPREVTHLFRAIAGPESRPVQLLLSDAIELPLTFPGWHPVILLPAAFAHNGDAQALRYCLAHEWSHIERGDIWRWYLATLGQFFFFYQPLFWWLRWQLRLCQDYLADARAAEQAEETEDYAEYLVALPRRLAVPTAALGIGDRRSNLYRRITMLLQTHPPLERRCLTLWTVGATLAACLLLVALSTVRLDAGTPTADEKNVSAKDTPKESPKDKPAEPGETLHYTGKVTDQDTGKPLAAATVIVRRSLLGDPEVKEENPVMQETKHQTDAEGRYQFTIPPEQSAKRYLYIELDVEHPDYAPRKHFGYSLSMIRKNEKLGGRPFFEHVQLRPGKPITGVVLTPEGKPAVGIRVLAYSNTDKKSNEFEYGSFADTQTDTEGRFRLTAITPGPAVFWILPEDHVPATHAVKDGQRGELGSFTLVHGLRLRGKVLDAKGNPAPGIYVNAESQERNEALQNLRVGDQLNRTALTNDQGEFEMRPLPPGKYRVRPDERAREAARPDRRVRPLPGVFLGQTVTVPDGAEIEPVELRAVPHVLVQAQYVDSKGKPTRGHECFIFGQIDGQFWNSRGKPDANGKIVAQVPHGLGGVRMQLMTNEHGVLRWRTTKDGPLDNKLAINLGTLNDDVEGIEIIRYVAPIVLINAKDQEGQQVKGFQAQVVYGTGKSPREPGSRFVNGVQGDVYLEKQEDGRWRTSHLLPDEEVTVTVRADGYDSKSIQLKLPEGETKELDLVLAKVSEKKEEE